MEGRARRAPSCKIYFRSCFEKRVELNREERRDETLLQSALKHIVKRHSEINKNRAVFPACCCSCAYVFMNECLCVL
jgi:predicted Zn-ribbon and HTH transcriptional regulator